MRELIDALDGHEPVSQRPVQRRPAMSHAIPPSLREETPPSTGSQPAMSHEARRVIP